MKNNIKFTIHKENLDLHEFNYFMYNTLDFIDSATCTFKNNKISLSNVTFLTDKKDNDLVAAMKVFLFQSHGHKFPNQTYQYRRQKMIDRQQSFNEELVQIIKEQLQRHPFILSFKLIKFGALPHYSINNSAASIDSVKSKNLSLDKKSCLIELDLKVKQYELIHKTLKNIYRETILWDYFPYRINSDFLKKQIFKFDR